ncbi:CocE/NonD family hydrolase [Aurantimonas sp. MSK8Z-1]|uniref:CocE/NonD family hydrolase n=1 Tax=Mangrovibrevibacter kandeliae TaxID=2968473 RepID=UPI002117B246|nr:CocE/NonD family hydrolase [Aurantimonas sp. MSK8Z-1]MCW4115350.1 CocE/NonD family hydrolase [Aurantimonas sp. MSK8Z-1]
MPNRPFSVIENEWITLADGTRLAARIWMPDEAEVDPVPAVLEFLPYRKRDGTSVRDEATYPAFAEAGFAGVRVDMRGSGESDGVIDGEYTPRELSDAVEVIAWIAAQPWCTGAVGMMGISWGGFNSLQVAALNPPALKAVISIASTVDRYNDDIHYKNGCHLSANLSWASTMLAYQSRAPDPDLVGERWREMWLERLEGEPFFLEEWLAHQRRDAFWQHGSIAEDWSAYRVPTFIIAGWADGYRNTPFKFLEGSNAPKTALVGPWVHKYPHFAWPRPRADFLNEAIAWWGHWLKDEDTGVERWPELRAYLLDGPQPLPLRQDDPGEWVAKPAWKVPEVRDYRIAAGGRLADTDALLERRTAILSSPEDLGVTSGEWFTLKPDAEMAGDQRRDDGLSLTFDSAPTALAADFLGQPELRLRLSSDKPATNLVARLVDVHPDGTTTRIAYGVLNLAHRSSYAEPEALPVGEPVEIAMRLDACGYRLKPGHRLRLALSTAYWPTILPQPETPTLALELGSLVLSMPLLGEAEPVTVPEPENPDPLPKYEMRAPAETRRRVTHDLTLGRTLYEIHEDTGLAVHPDTGLAARQVRSETWSIDPRDPLSMTGEARWITENGRDDWTVRTETACRIACTREDWLISADLVAYEGEAEVCRRTWERTIPRDFM